MTKSPLLRILTAAYIALFFAYLFGPLIVMVISAFNSRPYPAITPWECLTFEWFGQLANDKALLTGLKNSLIIGFGVVCASIPIGLAAALTLTQVSPRLRGALYAIFIAPILMPGVVIGLSTLLLWSAVTEAIGGAALYNGIVMTIFGQVTFISAYAMLVFLARLQRFDHSLTEAALDLGATPAQAFRKILLPFLKPAILSAVVLTFLASLENFNTTYLSILADSTFTTVLASKARYGIDPSISAVAVIIIGITLMAAIIVETHKKRQKTIEAGGVAAERIMASPFAKIMGHPAFVAAILVFIIGSIYFYGKNHDAHSCKAQVKAEKIERNLKAIEKRNAEKAARKALEAETQTDPAVTTPKANTGFGGVFAPSNLGETAPAESDEKSENTPSGNAPKAKTNFGGVFAPSNLGETAPTEEPKPDEVEGSAPKPKTSFGGVFDPTNLGTTAPAD